MYIHTLAHTYKNNSWWVILIPKRILVGTYPSQLYQIFTNTHIILRFHNSINIPLWVGSSNTRHRMLKNVCERIFCSICSLREKCKDDKHLVLLAFPNKRNEYVKTVTLATEYLQHTFRRRLCNKPRVIKFKN